MLREALLEGGWGMAPLVVLAALTLAVVLERARALLLPRADAEALVERIATALRASGLPLALRSTSRHEGPAARVARAALLVAHEDSARVETALSIALALEVRALSRGVGALAALAQIATLVGLLGTITGLVIGFRCTGTASPSAKAELLAAAIGEALHCTGAGIAIALVALAFYGLVRSRALAYESELDWIARATLSLVDEHRAASARAAER